MIPEMHLFILWDKVGVSRETVLQRIRTEFDVLRVFRIRWSPSLFSRNLSRFYGQNLPAGCNKEESCGTGAFTLVVVRDNKPEYALRDTTRGVAEVNIRTFDLKAHFRSQAGGNLPIHATNTPSETARDLTLLLGIAPANFMSTFPEPWSGEIIPLHQDIAGAYGWKSIGDFFAVLNECLDYVVLRNFECLPDQYHLEAHGDIDLLVSDYTDACLIANATPVFGEPYRVHHTVIVSGKDIPFDFRYVGDGYYDERWERNMLESRIFTAGGFYAPDAENHFYSLLYHAAVHKHSIAPDYVARLTSLAEGLGIRLDDRHFFADNKKNRACLKSHIDRNGYRFTKPHDDSVYFNTAVAHNPIEQLLRPIFPGKKRLPPNNNAVGMLSHKSPDKIVATEERANLIRPFRGSIGQRVLELGCGGGSITRYLGETGADVVAVESNPGLAALTKDRCHDLPNVEVICDDPMTAQIEGQFDCILLVDANQRASAGLGNDDTLSALLKYARALLKNDGMLLLAIENQLGLKYFNGCAEDHTNIQFFGIYDLYNSATPITFGKKELTSRLHAAGFTVTDFYYPFPDHQLPEVILSEAALVQENFRPSDLLYRIPSRDNGNMPWRAFHENLAWRCIARNGLVGELANSFLVVAGNSPQKDQAHWLAYVFSTRRLPAFATETIFRMKGDAIAVTKNRLSPDLPAPQELPFRHHPPLRAGYVTGELYAIELQRIMARAGSLDEVAQWVAPWLAHLQQRADTVNNHLLPGDCLDVIPANLVRTLDGNLVEIDAEWSAQNQIPMSWVLIRGLANAFASSPPSPVFSQMNYREAIGKILDRLGHTLSDCDFQEAGALEDKLQRMVNGPGWKGSLYGDILSRPIRSSTFAPTFEDKLAAMLAAKQIELDHADNEISRIKSTISWKLTKPLRLLANLPNLTKEVLRRK